MIALSGPPAPSLASDDVAPMASIPEHVGRYRVLRFLGAGGMGEVYSAWDPQLERRVAVKLLHRRPRRQGAHPLLREAQAMARVSHPNVVTVFDVGETDGRVFIAMEFVSGGTLRDAHGCRAQDELLACYRAAGRGLAAVHAGGLVHRDFKPDNVVIGSDERVRVLDFGIAAHSSACAEASSGTREYMAPEQYAFKTADARSDQFAFCVSLYEALEGVRPFQGETPAMLAASVCRDEPRPMRVISEPRLRATLLRGLSKDPNRRFPNMEALLASLIPAPVAAPTPPATRASPWAVAAGMGSGAVALVIASTNHDRPCTTEPPTAAIWSAQAADEVRSSFRRTSQPFATRAADQLIESVDGYVRDWEEQWSDLCEATQSSVEQPEKLERTRQCLQGAQARLEALVERARDADDATVQHANGAAAGLPDISRCGSLASAAMSAVPPPATQDRADVNEARRSLGRAKVMLDLGQPSAAERQVAAATRISEGVDYPPLNAEIAHLRGLSARARHELSRARASLETAYFVAYGSQHWRVAAEAAVRLSVLVGRDLAHPTEGATWLEHAKAAGSVIGEPGAEDVELLLAEALLHGVRGDAQSGLRLVERGLEASHGDADQRTRLLRAKGEMLLQLGRFGSALEVHRQLHQEAVDQHGQRHPEAARALLYLGAVQYATRHVGEARRLAEEAAGIYRRTNTEPLNLANALQLLAAVEALAGDPESAARTMGEVVRIRKRWLGPSHRSTLGAQTALAGLYSQQGDPWRAVELHESVLAMQTDANGVSPLDIADTQINLSNALEQVGQPQRAVSGLGPTCDLLASELGPLHPTTAMCNHNLGRLRLTLGQPELALVHLEAASAAWIVAFGRDDPRLCSTDRVRALAHIELDHPLAADAAATSAWNCDNRQPQVSDRALLADATVRVEARLASDDTTGAWLAFDEARSSIASDARDELASIEDRIRSTAGERPRPVPSARPDVSISE